MKFPKTNLPLCLPYIRYCFKYVPTLCMACCALRLSDAYVCVSASKIKHSQNEHLTRHILSTNGRKYFLSIWKSFEKFLGRKSISLKNMLQIAKTLFVDFIKKKDENEWKHVEPKKLKSSKNSMQIDISTLKMRLSL